MWSGYFHKAFILNHLSIVENYSLLIAFVSLSPIILIYGRFPVRIVHLVSGSECKSTLLSAEAMSLLQALISQTSDAKELARLSCQAGLCPVLLRDKLTK